MLDELREVREALTSLAAYNDACKPDRHQARAALARIEKRLERAGTWWILRDTKRVPELFSYEPHLKQGETTERVLVVPLDDEPRQEPNDLAREVCDEEDG